METRTLILEKVAHARSPGKDELSYIFDNLGLIPGGQRSEPLGEALFKPVSPENNGIVIFAIEFDEPLCLGGTVESDICGHLSVNGGHEIVTQGKGQAVVRTGQPLWWKHTHHQANIWIGCVRVLLEKMVDKKCRGCACCSVGCGVEEVFICSSCSQSNLGRLATSQQLRQRELHPGVGGAIGERGGG